MLAEYIFMVILVVVVFSQVILPPFINMPYFFILRPWSRIKADPLLDAEKRRKEIEKELMAAKAELEVVKLQHEADRIRYQTFSEIIDDDSTKTSKNSKEGRF